MTCFVKSCKNIRRLLPPDSGITFHKFPMEKERFLLWLGAIGKTGKSQSEIKNCFVCSDHLQAVVFSYKSGRKCLKISAVPSTLSSGIELEPIAAGLYTNNMPPPPVSMIVSGSFTSYSDTGWPKKRKRSLLQIKSPSGSEKASGSDTTGTRKRKRNVLEHNYCSSPRRVRQKMHELNVKYKVKRDACETSVGAEGVCRFLTKCPSALDDIKKGIFPRDICGYQGTQSIICCKSNSTPKPVTSPTTVIREPPVTVTNKVTQNPNVVGTSPGERAVAKCKEYSQYAYEKVVSQTLSLTASFSKILECPIQTQTLIVGGTKASRKEFPHMIQIGYITGTEITWDCAGSLISPRFVLTASHCLRSSQRGDAKLARGGITNQSETTHLQTRNIIERIKHPEYDYRKYHDIALLRLDNDFILDTYLRPACVFPNKNIPMAHAIATGWGKTDFAGDEGSDALLKVTLEFFSTAKCNNTYRRMIQSDSELSKGIVEDLMVCAGSSTDKKDTCQGDSGGPLQVIHPSTPDIKCMYDVVGVTSFGIACGLAKNLPGVYTRVSYYTKWIEDIVWPV